MLLVVTWYLAQATVKYQGYRQSTSTQCVNRTLARTSTHGVMFQSPGTLLTTQATYSQTEVTIYGQSNAQGVSHQIGSGDLTQDTLWDASAQNWVPVGSS